MNQQDTFLLHIPKAGHLTGPLLFMLTVLHPLWVSGLGMCNLLCPNRLVCRVPAGQAWCTREPAFNVGNTCHFLLVF